MTFRYYKSPTGDQVFVEAECYKRWSVVGRSKHRPVALDVSTLSGTKITRDEAVDIVGEDHITSAEVWAQSGR